MKRAARAARAAKPQSAAQTDRRARLLDWGIRFFMAAALTGNRTAGGYAPFALGCVAAAGPGMNGAAALLGTAAGAAVFMDFADALPFLASGVLILAAAAAFRGSRVMASPAAVSLTASALFSAVAGIYVLESFTPEAGLLPCLAAAGLTGAAAWFFRPLLQPQEGREAAEGVLFLSASLLLAMQEVVLGGLSLGRILLCALLAWTAFRHGPAAGAAAGLGVGLTAELCAGGGNGVLTAALGLGSLLCGEYHGRKQYRAALLFLAGTLAVLLGGGDPLTEPLLAECGVGMALFLLLPAKQVDGKRVQHPEPRPNNAAGELKDRLSRAAEALRELYESGLGYEAEEEENPSVIFDRSAERVCRSCALCDLCWREEYAGTFQAMDSAAPRMLDRGRAVREDFPSYFTSRCAHLPDLLSAINTELTSFLQRRRYRRELAESRREAWGQYGELAELLSSAAEAPEPARNPTGPVPAVEQGGKCRLAAELKPRRGERVCGDTAESFRTPDGLWCLLLADGMGTGEGARKESALVCRLLRQFLEAGVRPEPALKTLNTAMALRGEETGSFTTMDLCTFDGVSGEAAFYKYGAAPSYLKRGAVVRRITGSSLPVGLRTSPAGPDVTRVPLEPGSFAVLISDGVADPGGDQWLQELLADWKGEEPQELAGAIVRESVRRLSLADDCGVQILYRPRVSEAVPA